MDNAQNCGKCINMPSSQTCRSYRQMSDAGPLTEPGVSSPQHHELLRSAIWQVRFYPKTGVSRKMFEKISYYNGLCIRGNVVVKALSNKPEGRRFGTRWYELPSSCTRPWDLLSLETEMSNWDRYKNASGGTAWLLREDDNLNAICEPTV
jgi:hypothetical protein